MGTPLNPALLALQGLQPGQQQIFRAPGTALADTDTGQPFQPGSMSPEIANYAAQQQAINRLNLGGGGPRDAELKAGLVQNLLSNPLTSDVEAAEKGQAATTEANRVAELAGFMGIPGGHTDIAPIGPGGSYISLPGDVIPEMSPAAQQAQAARAQTMASSPAALEHLKQTIAAGNIANAENDPNLHYGDRVTFPEGTSFQKGTVAMSQGALVPPGPKAITDAQTRIRTNTQELNRLQKGGMYKGIQNFLGSLPMAETVPDEVKRMQDELVADKQLLARTGAHYPEQDINPDFPTPAASHTPTAPPPAPGAAASPGPTRIGRFIVNTQ